MFSTRNLTIVYLSYRILKPNFNIFMAFAINMFFGYFLRFTGTSLIRVVKLDNKQTFELDCLNRIFYNLICLLFEHFN